MSFIECVPNFSEGRNMQLIAQIAEAVKQVKGVCLLGVEPGKAANRTVVTFAGAPEAVCEAAFRAVEKATALIDMRLHHGAHPRFGATDVLPLIPLSGITMEETAELARRLAKRIGETLQFPVYCYENSAFYEKRRNLAYCRSGEYEGLENKLTEPEWQPDFGPAQFVPKTGAVAVGARPLLVAYNVNLNTADPAPAKEIALEIREKGRLIKDENGHEYRQPGLLKAVKAMGWYIEEYGKAQVSMNLTDITVTPLHVAFDTVCRCAQARGLQVTGSELIGLIPLQAMLDAGRYFLTKQQRPTNVCDHELLKVAVQQMGLDELAPFDVQQKIIKVDLGS